MLPTDPHAQTLAQRLSEALKALAFEAAAVLNIEEPAIRALVGHTNVNALRQRIGESRALLLEVAVLTPEPVTAKASAAHWQTRWQMLAATAANFACDREHRHYGTRLLDDMTRLEKQYPALREPAEPVTPPPSAPAETQEQRLNRILNEPDLPVTILPDGTVAPARDADGRGLAVDVDAELRHVRQHAGTVGAYDAAKRLAQAVLDLRALHAACETTINDAKGQEADLLDRLHKTEQERDALRTALERGEREADLLARQRDALRDLLAGRGFGPLADKALAESSR